MSISHPTSLPQAIATAEEIELAIEFSRRPSTRYSGNTSQGCGSGADPGSASRGNPKGRWGRGGGRRGGISGRNSSGPGPKNFASRRRPAQPNPQAQIRFHMSVKKLDTFALAVLNSDLEALGTEMQNLLETGRTLAHNVGLGRLQGQTGIKIPNFLESMQIRTMMSRCMIRWSRISSICHRETELAFW